MALRILIICGGGASSGFLAQGMRKAARGQGVEATVEARSESEVEEYVGRVDVVLVGPHLAFMLDHIRTLVEPHGIKVSLVPQAVYGRLDGAAAFKLAQDLLSTEGVVQP
jgi:cellobiose PTS system EIIB component